nr:hypothetical protein [Tanacetum cinerariifolium]
MLGVTWEFTCDERVDDQIIEAFDPYSFPSFPTSSCGFSVLAYSLPSSIISVDTTYTGSSMNRGFKVLYRFPGSK